ncbi:M1 family aminopeptidase [Robertkochia flava]|uniref:M1 family aminopeptidase n=1 Tax=Robertkochia flava TaxID=3447986 RepID=UPI001CD02122|nr:M1 family aminopeptidase [Robertkochia marina]
MKSISLLALFSLFSLLNTAQEIAVKTTLSNLERSVTQGDTNLALSNFNSKQESFYNDQKRYLANLTRRDSLDYSLEVHTLHLSANNQTATAVVLETARYWKYDRTQTDIGFKTYTLEWTHDRWMINAVTERVYLKGKHHEIQADFFPEKGTMNAEAIIDLDIVEEGEKAILFWLNRGLKVDRLEDVHSHPIAFTRKDLAIIIPRDHALKKGESLSLKIHYSGSFYNEFKELGYGLADISEEGIFGSWGTDWYPKLNGPLSKAKALLKYTVPAELIVASVGRLEEQSEHGGKVTYTYNVNTPMDYTFNANRFILYSHEVNGVQVNAYLINGSVEKAKMYADNAGKMIEFLTGLYGVFPCDSYGISEVPIEKVLGLGGSGGQGLNYYPTHTLRDETFEFPLIAHEVGHIWWGGLVNSDIHAGKLLDEGMAQVNAFLCYRHFYGESAMWDFINNGSDLFSKSARFYFRQFNSSNDFPIGVYEEERSNDYAVISYLKPHFIMAMLMETIGYDTFIKGIRRIINEYSSDKRLDIPAIRKVMEEESQQDLGYFFNQWFYRAGAPEFTLQYNSTKMDDGRYLVEGHVDQVREVFQVQAEIQLSDPHNTVTKKILIDQSSTSFSFLVEFEPALVQFDPHHKILRWSENVAHLHFLSEGLKAYYSGNKVLGLDKLELYLKHYPYDPTGHVIMGEIFINEKKYDLAGKHLRFVINEYETLGRMSYDIPLAYALMGSLSEKEGKPNQAHRYFSKALKMVNIEGSHTMAKEYFSRVNNPVEPSGM